MELEKFPQEVFETVLKFLDLNTIKALRLTNRRLSEICIGPRFLGFIQQPSLDVSPQSFRSLHSLACNPALSKVIHSLKFVATSFDSTELAKNVASGKYVVRTVKGPFFEATTMKYTPEELFNANSDLEWLKEKQELRASESSSEMIGLLRIALQKFSGLEFIHLDGAVITGPRCTQRKSTEHGEWHPLWMRASHVLSLVLTAMVQSGVSVKKLDVYRNTPRCCIPSGHITSYVSGLSPNQLAGLSKDLVSFAISLSAEIQTVVEFDDSDDDELSEYEKASRTTFGSSKGHLTCEDPRATLANGTQGVTSLLKYASSLQELDLSFRHALYGKRLDSYDRIVENIASEAQFPKLQHCAFSGFFAKEESILLLLQKHPDIRSLKLHDCDLTAGSWTPIFGHLSRSMPALDNLDLSNLSGNHMTHRKRPTGVDHPGVNNTEQEQEMVLLEVGGLVSLYPVWDTEPRSRLRTLSKGDTYIVHTRSFNQEELKKGLVFRPEPGGRTKGSAEGMWWGRSRQALYGCP
ncbi:uncharacterized protein N7511_003925 [Penicillium nucicola]|uniref:uncharacterized protein n=1 Tax=Penicillium nucicola TaxID=1850975 RepID=UPI0025450A5B|nr:uncharacterized protein N7511_003925 [Penicillium nucicola]KAJ5766309.1 hypothetical protein N7511_003925 [Penicillium nucicola]